MALPAGYTLDTPDTLPAGYKLDTPAAVEAPGAVSRFFSSVGAAINPIPGIQEWANRPSALKQAMGALGALQASKDRAATPDEQATIDRGMSAPLSNPMGYTPPPLSEPLLTATGQAQQGNVAGATGTLVGGYGVPMATGKLLQKGGTALREGPVPGALRASAERQYARVLNPTTGGNKLRTAKVVPELIDRGVVARTTKALGERTAAEVQTAGQALGDAYEGLPADASVPIKSILGDMEKVSQEALTVSTPNGNIPMSDAANTSLAHIDGISKVLNAAATVDPATGELAIPVATARRLRQYYDDVKQQAGGYDGKSLADQSSAAAHGMAADAIRAELATSFPDLAALNKEYKFWKDTDRVVQDTLLRRQGQAKPLGQKLMAAAGTGAGFASGGVHGAVLGKLAMSQMEKAVTSTGWNTVSAVLKDKLANAIAGGERGPIEFYAGKAAREADRNATIAAKSAALVPALGAQNALPPALPNQLFENSMPWLKP